MGGRPDDEQQRHQPGTEICIPQSRKMVQKRVVTVKEEGRTRKLQKVDGPPDDLWSWRKYGQKAIKGSPFPRGYYKCSTVKGCTAKKQVERCRTDATLLIITYTSTHNHSAPKLPLHGNSDAEEAQTPVGPNSTTVKSDLEARDSAEEEHAMTSSTKSTQEPSSEENDFFDELEELPIFSSTSLQRNSFFDDGILVPS